MCDSDSAAAPIALTLRTNQEIFHPTFDQPGTRGLLVSYMLVGVGQRVGAMDPEVRAEFASHEMEKVHPGLLDHLEGCVSKVWPADPFGREELAPNIRPAN
jgi:monoamine oxidase